MSAAPQKTPVVSHASPPVEKMPGHSLLAKMGKRVLRPGGLELTRRLFGFGAGQELSQHTASMPAIMHFLRGEADVGLGADTVAAAAGTWIHMPAELPHSVHAKTPVVMLLTLLKQSKT